jgi:hypothetical protein
MKMISAIQCPLVGCGEKAVASAPSHHPFAKVVFEELARPAMTPTCDEHADVLWAFYRDRVALALLDGASSRVSVSDEAINGVAWTLNSHNDATSKSVAALLSAVGRDES